MGADIWELYLGCEPPREVRKRKRCRRPHRGTIDVKVQRLHDAKRKMDYPQLEARFAALMDARKAVRAGSNSAAFAERQALVDLAACAEEMAARRLPPHITLVAAGVDD